MAYEIKTKVNNKSVPNFLSSIVNSKQKEDCMKIYSLMKKITNEKARMFGDSIVGFGLYSYESKSCKGKWFYIGFSPRKAYISTYIMSHGNSEIDKLKLKLGKAKLGNCCVSIKKIEDVDLKVLEKILRLGYKACKKEYG